MEKRGSMRMMGVSEISLLTLANEPVTSASISDLSEGGMLVVYVRPEKVSTIAAGQKLKFHFVVPTGEVRGLAEVVRVDPSQAEIALRILGVENDGGLPNLLGFLHSAFCGVD